MVRILSFIITLALMASFGIAVKKNQVDVSCNSDWRFVFDLLWVSAWFDTCQICQLILEACGHHDSALSYIVGTVFVYVASLMLKRFWLR